MKNITFDILDGELWWGGTSVIPATRQGYCADSVAAFNVATLGNQTAPLYLSSKDRI